MRKLKYVLLPVCILIIFSCQKINKGSLASENHQIMKGEWNYVHTIRNGVIDTFILNNG